MTIRTPLYALLLLLLTTLSTAGLQAAAFTIEKVETRLKGGIYIMDAQIGYRFSEKALEALENGVPLTLDLQVKLVQASSWFWDKELLDTHIRHTIRYHSLAETYQLFEHSTRKTSNFVTQDALLSELGEITAFELIQAEQLQPEVTYQVRLNVELDIGSLPLLLRPMAYLQSAWKLSSGWSRWPLEQ